jgi:pimeloyl-ACP methyl ester carboxylesterase
MTASFACETATRRSVLVNGLRLSALEWGRPGAPGLCLLHGGSAHAHWFDGVVQAVAGSFHVVALDQRGHGCSDWARPPAYATEDFAADLLGLMGALGWDSMSLVGHSMGGHNAMAFAAWHPERTRALCVVDSRPSFPAERLAAMHARGRRGPRPRASLEEALGRFRLLPPDTVAAPALLRHLAREGLMERDGAWLPRFDPQTAAARRPVDCLPLLGRVRARTLLVRGERSPVLTRPLAAEMLERLGRGRLVEIPGAFHHLTLDAPEVFARELAAFLAEPD